MAIIGIELVTNVAKNRILYFIAFDLGADRRCSLRTDRLARGGMGSKGTGKPRNSSMAIRSAFNLVLQIEFAKLIKTFPAFLIALFSKYTRISKRLIYI